MFNQLIYREMRKIFLFIAVAVGLCLSSCQVTATYSYQLDGVSKDGVAKSGIDGMGYEDEDISVKTSISEYAIKYNLKNKTGSEIWVTNDDALILGIYGDASMVTSGRRLDTYLRTTKIPSGFTFLDDLAVDEYLLGKRIGILPTKFENKRAFKKWKKACLGGTIGLYWPMRINGEKVVYNFRYKITDISSDREIKKEFGKIPAK